MSRVVEHLADLTGFRDRDVMDVTLVTALRDMLEPLSVAIYRCTGELGQERWLTRARLGAGDAVASADPLWAELSSLPLAAENPARLACMHGRNVMESQEGGLWLTLFPIATDREVVGVLEIESTDQLKSHDQRTVSSVLRIYHNFQGLLDYSERDTLTGLLNRKTFDESFIKVLGELPQHLAEAADGRRHTAGSHYFIGVVDIDHFKRVNDGFGHLIGDEVLLLLSRLMRSSFRFHDLLYRFGGEEFVVLMRCESDAAAAHAFARLRHNTEHYSFPQVGSITVSVGFTQVRVGDSPASAFERADNALYHAKHNGRNQVRNHAALVAAGQLTELASASEIELF
jgi:diguanylate cyclase (GGDEF)-like protein